VRTAGAVLAGNLTTGILAFVTDQLVGNAIPGFRSMPTIPLYYFLIILGTDTLYLIGGGYLCAAIAGASARKATLALIILGVVGSAVSDIWLWQYQPPWFAITLLVIYPLAVWCGSKLQRRNEWSTQSLKP
jgi:hypothetical protein